MNPIHNLADLFKRFPGIGPRQAKRFVYFLLSQDKNYLEGLRKELESLSRSVKQCQSCLRFFHDQSASGNSSLCSICSNPDRIKEDLMIVEKDVDLDSIEKAGAYHGLYFVLGGNIPILEKNPEERIRLRELFRIIEERGKNEELKEIIIALSATTEGDNTVEYLAQKLEPLRTKYGLNVSLLGRGLSTGSEIEYSDPETIKNALKNRH